MVEYGSNEIEIFAVDKSVNRNRGSLELVFDYNTEITGIDIISPEDDISDVDTSNVTFKWSGGNDEDGDTVFVELLYGTSKTSLNKKITGINCDTLDLTEELKSYTEYFWQVVAYSKVYPDTVKSSIYSFRTKAVPPVIISQSDENIDLDIGERIILRVSATGNPKPSYKWEKNGTVISGETDDSLVIDDASLTDSGGYVVQLNNEGGTIISDTIDLRVIYPVKIAAGKNHSLILKNDGTLFGCGLNDIGQLGCKTTTENQNTLVKIMDDVHSIDAGDGHSLIIKNNGTLYACGNNNHGQLGNNTTDNQKMPVEIAKNVKTVAAGSVHSLIVKNDGTMLACGWNGEGQLGDTTTEDKSTPVEIMRNISSVAAGGGHSLIVKNDGTLFTCGLNSSGQLGDTVFNLNHPVEIMENVKTVAAGARHSLIIKDDGNLFTCGWNGFWQLGDGSGNSQIFPVEIMNGIRTVSAGFYHSLILGNDGTLFVCGRNIYGQLGDLVAQYETPEEIMKDVKAIAAGESHSLILKNDGTLLACGWNYNGQLGDGTTEDKYIPVQIIPKQN